jgi:tetratricopeptide (TPR) repeat protein
MRRFSLFAVLLLFATSGLVPSVAQSPVTRQITGDVHLGGQNAPAGVPVVLQIVSSRYAAGSNEAEVAHTVTDKRGAFTFDRLETLGRNGGREFFAVSTQLPGYDRAFQVADLTFAAHGEVTLVLERAKPAPSAEASADSRADRGGTAAPSSHRPVGLEAREAMSRAQDLLFREHNAAASVEEFKKALKSDPWYGPGYVLLGLAYMQLQQWSDAQFAFSEATKVEPGNVQAYLGLGSAMNEQHNYSGAQKALEHALDLNPDSAEAHYELARTFGAQQKWEEAAPHARRSIEINSDYAGPHALMGNIYLMQQDLPLALAEFQEYLRLDPEGSLAPSVKALIAEIQKSMAESPQKRP